MANSDQNRVKQGFYPYSSGCYRQFSNEYHGQNLINSTIRQNVGGISGLNIDSVAIIRAMAQTVSCLTKLPADNYIKEILLLSEAGRINIMPSFTSLG